MATETIMPTERERERQIRTVACPVCKAKQDKPCGKRNKLGHWISVEISHYGRLLAWEATR